jgi:hypothetical protein
MLKRLSAPRYSLRCQWETLPVPVVPPSEGRIDESQPSHYL